MCKKLVVPQNLFRGFTGFPQNLLKLPQNFFRGFSQFPHNLGANLVALVGFFAVMSCSPLRHVETVIVQRDSLVIHDTTVVSYLEKERIVDIVPVYDTLKMETTYSQSISYVDTSTHSLKGSLVQKDTIPIVTRVQYIETIVTRDSIIAVPVEVTVEKPVVVTHYPTAFWFLLGFFIITIIGVVIRFYYGRTGRF